MAEEIYIREFEPRDAKEIVALHRESQECFEDMEVDEEFIRAIAQRVDYRFFVAVKQGALIGFSGVLYHPSLMRAEIGPLAVSKDCRRTGVGRMLIESCIIFARDHSIRRLIVKVKAENSGALGFFESRGFAREGFFREYTKDREDVVQLYAFT